MKHGAVLKQWLRLALGVVEMMFLLPPARAPPTV